MNDDNEGGDRCCFEDQCSIHCHCGSYRHRACHSQFSQLGKRFDYFADLTFAHIVVSLSIGASGTILESPRMNFLHWSHWLRDERGTDTVTVMERHKNSALMHQPPPDILADLNEKSLTQSNLAGLSRFRSQSLSEQQGPAVG